MSSNTMHLTLLALAASIALAACNREQPGAPAPAAGAEAAAPAAGAPAAASSPAVAAETAAPAPTREADAIAALDRMGVALRALDRFGLRAETSTDYVTDGGQKISVDGNASWRVRAPDRFVATVGNDRQQREFYYDGKTLAVWSPKLKYYTVIEQVPASIGELVTQAAAKGIEFPLPDLFLWGTPQAPLDNVGSAFLVGPAVLDGEQTDQYAFRQPDVDWQVWISRKTSLPAKVTITSQADPARPSYSARLHWDTRPGADPAFAFDPPADAKRVDFVSAAGTTADASAQEP